MVKKEYLIATVVLVAAAVAAVLTDNRNRPVNDARLKTHVFPVERVTEVDGIELAAGAGATPIAIERKDGGDWSVAVMTGGTPAAGAAFPADAKQILSLFDSLGKITFQELVTTKKTAWAGLGLDTPKILRLKGKGQDLLVLNIGESHRGGGQFVSIGAEERAYVVSESIPFNPDTNSWELKTLFDIKADDVKSVSFTPSAELKTTPANVSREKTGDPFKLADLGSDKENTTNVGQVGAVLMNVSFTKRMDLSNEEAKTALAAPSLAIVKLFDGRQITAKIGRLKATDVRYFLDAEVSQGTSTAKLDTASERVNQLMKQHRFEVSRWVGEHLERGREQLVEAPVAASPPPNKKVAGKDSSKSAPKAK